jgi:quercetin dioxygenase-like cupin family protein
MRTAIRSPLLALALIVVFAGTVLATPANSGFHPTTLARGTMSESVQYNTGAVKFQTKGAVDFVTVTITIDPLGSSGWHAHPGVLLVTVASGTETFYNEHCVGTVHAAGTASASFVESGNDAFVAHNESTTTPVVVYVTYIVPAGTTALRIDKANPGCPQN